MVYLITCRTNIKQKQGITQNNVVQHSQCKNNLTLVSIT